MRFASHGLGHTSTKVEFGHSALHVEEWEKDALGSVQLRQAAAPGPEQVPHGESHGAQMDAFAHLPSGVHEGRHLPGGSENGKLVVHVRHEEDEGASHVAQLSAAGDTR